MILKYYLYSVLSCISIKIVLYLYQIEMYLYMMHTHPDALTGDDEADKLVAAPLFSELFQQSAQDGG